MSRMRILKVTIWSQLPSSLSPQCIEVNGSSHKNCQNVTLVHPPALGRKLALTARMSGVSSESINLKKLSNSFTVHQISHGRNLKRWLAHRKSFIKTSIFHTRLLRLFRVLLMMQLLWNMILKLGSQATKHSESLFPAPIALTTNRELLEFAIPKEILRKVNPSPSCICLTELLQLQREHSVVSWRTTRPQKV
jgi:hypothetical protein